MTEETLFTAALEIPDAADRGKFLDWACAGDAALRGRVGRLLDRHERAAGFRARPAAGPEEGGDAQGEAMATDSSPGAGRGSPATDC
jgi:hypothetical protein